MGDKSKRKRNSLRCYHFILVPLCVIIVQPKFFWPKFFKTWVTLIERAITLHHCSVTTCSSRNFFFFGGGGGGEAGTSQLYSQLFQGRRVDLLYPFILPILKCKYKVHDKVQSTCKSTNTYTVSQILTNVREITLVTWMLPARTSTDPMFVNVSLNLMERVKTAQVNLISLL